VVVEERVAAFQSLTFFRDKFYLQQEIVTEMLTINKSYTYEDVTSVLSYRIHSSRERLHFRIIGYGTAI
jgi:hypothetical protein